MGIGRRAQMPCAIQMNLVEAEDRGNRERGNKRKHDSYAHRATLYVVRDPKEEALRGWLLQKIRPIVVTFSQCPNNRQ
jgi:hypothetical protein